MVADYHEPPKRPKRKDSIIDIYNNLGLESSPNFQAVKSGTTWDILATAIEEYVHQFIKK